MDLCEHISGYEKAIEYFPKCFDRRLKIKYGEKVNSYLLKRFDTLWKKENIDSEEFLEGYDYITYLQKEKMIFSNLKSREIKTLYIKYDNLLSFGDKLNSGYEYLLLLSIARIPILRVLEALEHVISLNQDENKIKEIKDFLSRWNMLLSNDRYGYNYIHLGYFIDDINRISKDNPLLMGYNNIFNDILLQMRNNHNIKKRKK